MVIRREKRPDKSNVGIFKKIRYQMWKSLKKTEDDVENFEILIKKQEKRI